MKSYYPKWQAWSIIAVLFAAPIVLMAAGSSIDLSAAAGEVRNILGSGNGGTNNGFFAVSGPSSTTKTFTFPNASSNVLTDNTAVTVPQGGTGVVTATAHGVMLGEGTSAQGTTAAGTTGQCFLGNTGADPSFQTCPSGPNFADNEVPSGTPNGSLTTFTLAHTPNPSASLKCDKDGLGQRAGGNDFTLSVATMTYGVAPQTGAPIVCSYRY